MNLAYCLKQNNSWKSWAMGATVACVILYPFDIVEDLRQTKSWENLKIKSTEKNAPRIMILWDEEI